MQGDISIASNSGTIVADKLRGAILDFNCNDSKYLNGVFWLDWVVSIS
jgi:hypothetical protein